VVKSCHRIDVKEGLSTRSVDEGGESDTGKKRAKSLRKGAAGGGEF